MTFTNFRWQPPKFAGDWRADERLLSRAISDYWLSLEKKGALNITLPDLPNFNLVNVEDYVNPDATDHTIGIQAAATQLIANGGGVLWFKPGKTYTVFTSGNATAINLTGLKGVTILGNGCTIDSAQTSPSNGAVFINVTQATDVAVDGFNFRGGNASLLATGEQFIYGYQTTNLSLTNCDIRDCIQGVYLDGQGTYSRGLVVDNCYFNRAYYPVNFYRVIGARLRYASVRGGRCLAVGSPAHNLDCDIYSEQEGSFSDAIFSIDCDSAESVAVDGNTISNVRLNYYTPGRHSDATDQDADEALIAFNLNQIDNGLGAVTSTAGHFRNIDVNFCVDAVDAEAPRNILTFRRYIVLESITGDGTSRVHTIRNFKISGSMLNGDDLTDSGIKLFPVTTIGGVAMNWTGDLIEGISLRDLHIKGAPTTDAIYVNGQGAVAGKNFVFADNVQVDGSITLANTSGAVIAGIPITTTPTPTAGSGTFTTVSASIKHTRFGNRVFYAATVTITTNGTAAGFVKLALPSTPATACGAGGYESSVSAKGLTALAGTDGFLYIRFYDSTYPGVDGAVLLVNGHYDT